MVDYEFDRIDLVTLALSFVLGVWYLKTKVTTQCVTTSCLV